MLLGISLKNLQAKSNYNVVGVTQKHTLASRWRDMLHRCYNPQIPAYKDYGGRGITVCTEWFVFSNFYIDMSPEFSKELSLDRIDNNGNYSKGNCRWATQSLQNTNKRKPNPKTHCIHGHEFTSENTYLQTRPNGYIFRSCKTCTKETSRKKTLEKNKNKIVTISVTCRNNHPIIEKNIRYAKNKNGRMYRVCKVCHKNTEQLRRNKLKEHKYATNI